VRTFFCTWSIVFVFFFGEYAITYAQTLNDSSLIKKDSLTYEHKGYEIFDYRGYDFTAGIRTVTVSPALLRNNFSMSCLSDAMQNIGSVYMRSYGNNMNNAITVRGFGPERTSVLWNGINVNNAGLGQLDLNLMPGGFFNSVQLIEGSSSTQYGSGAQGGSLLLEYKPDFTNRFSVGLQQEFGSFFAWNTAAQFTYGNGTVQGRTAFIRNSATNNYTYKDKTTIGFPVRETVNSNFFSYQGMQDVFFKLKRNWFLSLHGWYNYTDRKIPPAMGAVNNHSEQFDQNIRSLIQLRKSFEKHDIQIQVAYINDVLIYHTDAFKDSSQIHSGQVQIQYVYHPKKHIAFMAGGNFQINHSEYKYYNGAVNELRGNIFALINWNSNVSHLGFSRIIKLSAGIRQQFSTNYTAYPSAHLGLEYMRLSDRFRIHVSGAINSAYRMPTLNDLYWVPGGDPNLKPEYSWNIEHSYKFELGLHNAPWKVTFDLLGYFGRTSNWIQWTPTPFGYWAPQNITSVQSAGFEAGTGLVYSRNKWKFSFNAHYNFTHTTDINNNFTQLIYVPQHSVKGLVELKWNGIYFNLIPGFTSRRFTLSDNTQYIPSFFLFNINAGYTLQLKTCAIGFVGRLGNVTNADYQSVLNRPMPGINFNVGINFYLNTKTIKQNNK
jgi:vitamin B12 transporter